MIYLRDVLLRAAERLEAQQDGHICHAVEHVAAYDFGMTTERYDNEAVQRTLDAVCRAKVKIATSKKAGLHQYYADLASALQTFIRCERAFTGEDRWVIRARLLRDAADEINPEDEILPL